MKNSLLFFSTCLLLSACGGQTNSDLFDNETPDAVAELEQSYAGITATDEVRHFGDREVEAQDTLDDDMPMQDAPERDRSLLGAVVVTLRYGSLADHDREGDGARTGTVTDAAVWRFRLAALGGAFARGRLYVERTDNPNLTRVAPGVVTWQSTTPPGDHDGARFAIILAEDARGITVATAGAEFALSVRDLADHESVHRTDLGTLYVRTYRVVRDNDGPDLCAGGTMRGRATGLNDDGVGRVVGVVRNHEGDIIGHLRGRYGVRQDGSQVFFAKLIGREGEFMGRARGSFERIDDGTLAVRARFHERDGRAAGIIRGRIIHKDDERRGAAFLARWAYTCDDSMPRDRLPPESDGAERARDAAR